MRNIKITTIIFIILCFIALPSPLVLARAGGGGGSGSSGNSGEGDNTSDYYRQNDTGYRTNVLDIVVVLVLASTSSIAFSIRLYKKSKEAKSLMMKLQRQNSSWNYNEFSKRVEKVFYRVQNAWMERDQELASDCMSKELYEKHKAKTDWMIIRHEKNILKKIRLLSVKPVGVTDLTDDCKGAIWVCIQASMADYIIDDQSMQIISGKTKVEKFIEFWKFTKGSNDWVLDEISKQYEGVGIEDLEFDSQDTD